MIKGKDVAEAESFMAMFETALMSMTTKPCANEKSKPSFRQKKSSGWIKEKSFQALPFLAKIGYNISSSSDGGRAREHQRGFDVYVKLPTGIRPLRRWVQETESFFMPRYKFPKRELSS